MGKQKQQPLGRSCELMSRRVGCTANESACGHKADLRKNTDDGQKRTLPPANVIGRTGSSRVLPPRHDRQNTCGFPENACQARIAKIILFPNDRNYDLTKPSRPHEGRFAIVTIRGAGCDGRISPQDVRYDAYGQAAWSCPPDAGVKPRVISPGRRRLSSPVLRGERGVSRKTMAQGVPE